ELVLTAHPTEVARMCFSNFLNHLSLDRIEADYSNIL
ncbi:hypothetical protein, partial [Pseudomonas syringae]